MKPYDIQNFKSDRGEVDSVRRIAPGEGAERLRELQGTDITLSPEADTVYLCGTLSALTLSDFPASGSFVVIFRSGAVPTVLTVPVALAMPEDFTVEANTRYEIHVRDGYALAAGWQADPAREEGSE
jgi:hypothetical protein